MKKKDNLIGKLVEALTGEKAELSREKLVQYLTERGMDRESVNTIVKRMQDRSGDQDVFHTQDLLQGVRIFNALERMLFTEEALDKLTLCKYLGLIDENDMEETIEIALQMDILPVEEPVISKIITYISGIDLDTGEIRFYQ
ncbi:MAG TPA: DUF494 family protein [Candidatus Mcinerneyibacteriales bacterium]|nr:DUF494 family protein [Candidatus Mcinerneyibacteriales bacterium]